MSLNAPRLFAGMAIAATAAALVSGCGSSSNSSSSSTPAPASRPRPPPPAAPAPASPPRFRPRSSRRARSRSPPTRPTRRTSSSARTGRRSRAWTPTSPSALAQALGLKAKVVNATFDSIIPGLAAHKYDLGMSSFTDTKEREKTVDFVTYFSAGTSFYEKARRPAGHRPREPLRPHRRRREGHHPAGRRDGAVQEVHRGRQDGRDGADLPRPERREPRAVERPRAGRHGRLAGGRLPGQAVERPVQGRRHALRHRALRDRDPEGQRAAEADPRRAQAAHRRTARTRRSSTKWGIADGAITNPAINGATS